jgi:hypothetical protein
MAVSDALKIARLHHTEMMVKSTMDLLIALEPLVVICGSALALGYLENERWGERQYQLISTNQKRALLTGVVAIEVARSGLVGQVAEGTKGLVGGVGDVLPALLAAI